MKKILALLVIAFAIKAGNTDAQTIPNNGFEGLNPDGSLVNWGNVYLMAMWIDSLGSGHVDSVVFDNQYFFGPSNDAHSGSTALELSNAWDFTTNTGIVGKAAADDDSVFSSWSLLNLVPIMSTPFNQYRPFNFGFYYKFFPVNGDSAYAEITMWDTLGYPIGEGMFIITGAANNYTYAEVPINYTAPDAVAFYSLSFSAFYTAEPGSLQPGFGTRLLVDDITFDNAAVSATKTIQQPDEMRIFPNPASKQIHINSGNNSELQFYLYNASGQLVMLGSLPPGSTTLPIENLDNGFYNIELVSKNKKEKHSFIVRN